MAFLIALAIVAFIGVALVVAAFSAMVITYYRTQPLIEDDEFGDSL